MLVSVASPEPIPVNRVRLLSKTDFPAHFRLK